MYFEQEKNKGNFIERTRALDPKLEIEYDSLRHGVGIRDISNSLIIQLTGKDTLDFINRISTNYVKDLSPMHCINTLFTNEKGRLIDKTIFLNMKDYFLLIGSEDAEQRLNVWINRYIIMEDIKTEVVTNNYFLMQIDGPQSSSFLSMICGIELKNMDANDVYYIQIGGVDFYLFKNFLKKDFYTYYLLSEKIQQQKIIDYLYENKSAFDLTTVRDAAYNIFRIEEGLTSFPNEINDNYNPHENGLIEFVSFTKGCYIGQEVIARLNTYDKVQRELKGIIFLDDEEISPPEILYDSNANQVVELTSVCNSKRLNKKIGLAYIKKKNTFKSSEVELKTASQKKLFVKIIELPFSK